VTKNILRAVLVVVTILAVLTMRVVVAGELEIAESSRSLVAGDPHAAVAHARAAALWYAPGAPHVKVAYDRLLALGKAAEEHHDREVALFAYRAVTDASASTRWFVTPHAADARAATEAIARIESTAPRPPDQALEPAQVIEREQLDELSKDHGPRTGWVVTLAASFVAWAAGLLWVLLRGFDGTGRVSLGRAAIGLVVGGAGLASWIVALYSA
jgi:hypothetical protein